MALIVGAATLESQLAAYRDRVAPTHSASDPRPRAQKHLYDLIAGQLSRDGKGIRPALCLATCGAFGGDVERALPSAAAIELLHNAFLVHDDIEDGSDFRRDGPTVHRQYGIPLALNAGDAMNAMSVRVLKQNLPLLGPELGARIFDEFDHMSIETIEGQAMELGWIRDNDCDTSDEDYLLMVLKKTSWYSFIHPARIGALIAQPEGMNLDGFNRFGHYLGTAFQIQTTCSIWRAIVASMAKRSAAIFSRANARSSLPTSSEAAVRTRRSASDPSWQNREPSDCRARWPGFTNSYSQHGSIDYAREAARTFAEAAKREFDLVYALAMPGPDLAFLESLVDYMVNREA